MTMCICLLLVLLLETLLMIIEEVRDVELKLVLVLTFLQTYGKAMRSIDVSFWKKAIKSELDFIVSNQTSELVKLPKGCKPISSKWIFKKKLRPNSCVDKYKARLVMRGFNQKKMVDCCNIYSRDSDTIRTLVAVTDIDGVIIHQMDVKTTFLNGDLEEEIYMSQSKLYSSRSGEQSV